MWSVMRTENLYFGNEWDILHEFQKSRGNSNGLNLDLPIIPYWSRAQYPRRSRFRVKSITIEDPSSLTEMEILMMWLSCRCLKEGLGKSFNSLKKLPFAEPKTCNGQHLQWAHIQVEWKSKFPGPLAQLKSFKLFNSIASWNFEWAHK